MKKIRNKRTMIVGLIAVLIAAGGFYLIHHRQTNRQVPLFGSKQLIASDLSRARIAFGESGLNDYEIVDGMIHVPLSRRSEYIAAMSKHDALPESLKSNESKMPGVLLSRDERERRRLDEKRKRIQLLLNKLPFVREVWIDFDETRTSGLKPTTQRSILVAVHSVRQSHLELKEVATIREIVRGSKAGIANEDIVIADIDAGISYGGNNSFDQQKLDGSLAQQIQLNQVQQAVRQAIGNQAGLQVEVSSLNPLGLMLGATRQAPQSTGSAGGANQAYSVFRKSSDRRPAIEPAADMPVSVRITLPRSTLQQIVRAQPQIKSQPTSTWEANSVSRIRQLVSQTLSRIHDHPQNQVDVVVSRDPSSETQRDAASVTDWGQLIQWIRRQWFALMLITAALTCILILLKRNPLEKSQWKSATAPLNVQTPPSPASLPRTPNPPAVLRPSHSETPQERQLRQEISEYIQNHPDQATEILQDWMKDAA